MNNFCIQGEEQFKCKTPIFPEFDDEIETITIVLEYLKRFLPRIMSNKKDCYGKNIKIDPKDIGVTVQKDYGNYVVILTPTDDNSSYRDDNFQLENTLYAFQILMEVREDDSEGCLENLIKLKSGIKTLLVNMDINLGLNITIDGFSFDGPFSDPQSNNKIIRQGIYRFAISYNRVKKN